jgi:fructose-specific phosphotransferase system IIC component
MKLLMVKEIFGVAVLTAVLHYYALQLFLYWTVGWFDILMHILGGLLIGLIAISFIKRIHAPEYVLHKNVIIIFTLFSVLVVALTWELWEIFVGFTNVLDDQGDTILDVIMGLIGGAGALSYYFFKHLKD